MTKFYAIFTNRKSMRGVCSVFLMMLLAPLSGCSGFEDNNSRVELASGTVDNNDLLNQGTVLVYQLIRDYEDNQEAYIPVSYTHLTLPTTPYV